MTVPRITAILSLVWTLLTGCQLVASGWIILPPPPHPMPHPPIHVPQPIELRSMTVTTDIRDQVAQTTVEQVFFNPNSHVVEGTYLFPLPAHAVIEEFTLWINGKPTPAELLDAKKAQQIYEGIVRRMKDPALLQYAGGGLLKARVYPIDPRAEKRLKIVTRETLTSDFGTVAYRLALGMPHEIRGGLKHGSVRIDVQTTAELKAIEVPTHRADIQRNGRHSAWVSLNDPAAFSGRDFELLFSTNDDDVGLQAVTYRRANEDGYFWLIIAPQLEYKRRTAIPKDLVFVVDTSGSMAGEKMDQAKAALRFCLAQLSPPDRFAIVRFSTEAESLDRNWIPADPDQVARGNRFVADWQAIGGTNLEEALNQAKALPTAADRMQAVVLITDGKPTIGERDEHRLLTQIFDGHSSSPRMFTFGVGYEVNTHLLDKLAERSGGTRAYVAPEEDLEVKISNLYQKIQSPILTRVRLDCDDIEIKQMHPHPLPDVFAGSPLHVFGRYTGSGRARIVLSGEVAGKSQQFAFDTSFADEAEEHASLPKLWAQRRIGYLLDEIRLHGEDQELVDEVVRLARRHGILTPYTSYLIVEDEDQRIASGAMRRDQSLWEERQRRQAPRWQAVYDTMAKKTGADSVAASEAFREMAEAEIDAPAPTSTAADHTGNLPFRQVGSRGFYLREGVWCEVGVDDAAGTDQNLAFASPEYFALASAHPELGAVLALGPRIRFIHSRRVIEITSP